jgi:signal transduction histidine kinase
VRIVMFEAARELLLNVAKHARTKCAAVRLSRPEDGPVEMVVEDPGVGFDTSRLGRWKESRLGLGLATLRRRLELLGGSFEIASAPGEGTRATLRAPVSNPEAAD